MSSRAGHLSPDACESGHHGARPSPSVGLRPLEKDDETSAAAEREKERRRRPQRKRERERSKTGEANLGSARTHGRGRVEMRPWKWQRA